jgi:hypothetical protein
MPPFPTPPDIVSVLLFGVWIVYTLIAGSERMQRKSVVGLMNNHRSRWMAEMLRRDPRMVDTYDPQSPAGRHRRASHAGRLPPVLVAVRRLGALRWWQAADSVLEGRLHQLP